MKKHDAVRAEVFERQYKRNLLASVAFQMVGSELGRYSDEIAVAAPLGRELREVAATEELPVAARDRAGELAERWRIAAAAGVTGAVGREDEVYVTVAEVAALYDVTPQAVYKWIHRGVIGAHARPGGSYQVPVAALKADQRFDVGRARRLQLMLARRHESQSEVAPEEMLEQMRRRRRPASRSA